MSLRLMKIERKFPVKSTLFISFLKIFKEFPKFIFLSFKQ